MTVYEILSLNKELLLRLDKLGIRTSDYIQVDIYNDFLKYKAQGDKVTYAVLMLSKKYNLSERSIYSIIKRLSSIKINKVDSLWEDKKHL